MNGSNPKLVLLVQNLGHQCLMHWCWYRVFALGMVLNISTLMLGVSIGYLGLY